MRNCLRRRLRERQLTCFFYASFQQQNELLHAQSRLTNDTAQCTTIQFLVVGNRYLSGRLLTIEHHMTTTLPSQHETCLTQCFHTLPA
ncbi:MAG: hypothetical protein QXS68_07240 [Candidatus Methanomethylicaceae archaeon]